MDINLPSIERLRRSVIAVPPLARDEKLELAPGPNRKLIRYLENGGVSHLLYGGNALLYHIPLSEYTAMLSLIADSVSPGTLVCPAAGPTYGLLMDQANILREFDFPTVMVLPQRDITDPAGIARGIRLFAERLHKPVVVYLKFDRWLPVDTIRRLYDDGLVSWIKYAVVREDPREDDYLRELIDAVPAKSIVSGIGEQPAIVHLRDFGISSFTSGCVCVAPQRSMEMLAHIQAGRYAEADHLRRQFNLLEEQRNRINPIRVLHRAVELAGIANTGPMLPLLSELSNSDLSVVQDATRSLFEWEEALLSAGR
jgi:dihydrodipicolinate synthase/N-acetylneuraminate lyase